MTLFNFQAQPASAAVGRVLESTVEETDRRKPRVPLLSGYGSPDPQRGWGNFHTHVHHRRRGLLSMRAGVTARRRKLAENVNSQNTPISAPGSGNPNPLDLSPGAGGSFSSPQQGHHHDAPPPQFKFGGSPTYYSTPPTKVAHVRNGRCGHCGGRTGLHRRCRMHPASACRLLRVLLSI